MDGGFGERVARELAAADGAAGARVRCLGLPKAFADRYDADALLAESGLNPESIADLIDAELTR